MAYRDPDEDRTVQEAREKEAAAWVEALEAARVARIERTPRRWTLWAAVATGTCLGGFLAAMVTRAAGTEDPSAVLVGGGLIGFALGTGVALRLAMPKGVRLPRR